MAYGDYWCAAGPKRASLSEIMLFAAKVTAVETERSKRYTDRTFETTGTVLSFAWPTAAQELDRVGAILRGNLRGLRRFQDDGIAEPIDEKARQFADLTRVVIPPKRVDEIDLRQRR